MSRARLFPTAAARAIWPLVAALTAVALVGCAGTASQEAAPAGGAVAGRGVADQSAATLESPSAAASPGAGKDASSVPAKDRLVVRTKTLRVEVSSVSKTIDALRTMASRDGADITQLQVATASDQPVYRPLTEAEASSGGSQQPLQAYVTIRVPVAKYQSFIDEAAKLGKVLFQAESADDVTQQHIDLSARLANLRAEEIRLREFFGQAKNVTEMLQVEQELARVRGEIESMAAQVAYLERQAAMATLTIELAEPKPLVRPEGVDWGVGEAFTNSIRAFVGTLNVLIVILGPVLALAIFVGLPILLVVRFAWLRYRKRRAASGDAGDGSASTGDDAGSVS